MCCVSLRMCKGGQWSSLDELFKRFKCVVHKFNMYNCKVAPIPIIIGLKLSKDDDGSTVDPTLFKMLVGILMYLTVTRPNIMYE